jgi:hypothetical protein
VTEGVRQVRGRVQDALLVEESLDPYGVEVLSRTKEVTPLSLFRLTFSPRSVSYSVMLD